MIKIHFSNYASTHKLVATIQSDWRTCMELVKFLDVQSFIDVQKIERMNNGKISIAMYYQSGYLHKTKEIIKTLLAA